MAWDEWEQLKSDAAEKRSTQMQLNQGHPSTGVQQGDLKANQKELASVGDSAFRLFETLGRQGRDAWSSSQSAAKDLTAQGFALGGGLHHVQDRWEKQLQTLLDACAHISNHMDITNKSHQGAEYFIASTFSSISVLDKGFDGRNQS
ncbi:hypothetical protein [Streptomyces cavernicola]|uniref:AG1 protein n=1 Tax=Streptomyces cavernicola TaxID=3043613 RepID=A0ABT6SHH8_9ACTN|nr:hypothetical protein [Streptomyces sp. B-S-A6]MDI3407652.1 hypothetical protein [Streptomyces sp. B-S-A6]